MTLGILRPIMQTELELILSWRNSPSVRSNMYTRHAIGLAEHLAWWERTQSRNDQLYLMYECDGQPLGVVGFNNIDETNGNSSWAFYAAPDAPKGTGSKMEFLALEYAFKTLELHRLHGEILEFNTSVLKLHQKFGFKPEGIFREHHLVNGHYVNVHRIGILVQEWESLREPIRERLELLNRK